MNISLHMERLILTGVDLPSSQRGLLQASVEAELSRLLSEGGVGAGLARGALLSQLDGPPIEITAGADPVQLGRQIAQSVYGGIAP
ncbi:hypothetical protein [Massilia sp. CF038]|uniref:hypothetical protein n=1 Tax=Massilia sp. CF038 TaxID=1881045 RepID=UPI000912492D|nr:hypothetical protein [Massilia sp. CF038]SHG51573.1 hypothetical protein SAMN05428948_0818 [Massilia sp. CF038]